MVGGSSGPAKPMGVGAAAGSSGGKGGCPAGRASLQEEILFIARHDSSRVRSTKLHQLCAGKSTLTPSLGGGEYRGQFARIEADGASWCLRDTVRYLAGESEMYLGGAAGASAFTDDSLTLSRDALLFVSSTSPRRRDLAATLKLTALSRQQRKTIVPSMDLALHRCLQQKELRVFMSCLY